MIDDDMPARVARVEQRVADIDFRVNSLMPVVTTVAALSERLRFLQASFDDFRGKIDARDSDASRERRNQIRWAITLTVTIIVALASLGVAVVTSGGHP